jgi:hypothetical protein
MSDDVVLSSGQPYGYLPQQMFNTVKLGLCHLFRITCCLLSAPAMFIVWYSRLLFWYPGLRQGGRVGGAGQELVYVLVVVDSRDAVRKAVSELVDRYR